jgi:hypothetical protein
MEKLNGKMGATWDQVASFNALSIFLEGLNENKIIIENPA